MEHVPSHNTIIKKVTIVHSSHVWISLHAPLSAMHSLAPQPFLIPIIYYCFTRSYSNLLNKGIANSDGIQTETLKL